MTVELPDWLFEEAGDDWHKAKALLQERDPELYDLYMREAVLEHLRVEYQIYKGEQSGEVVRFPEVVS